MFNMTERDELHSIISDFSKMVNGFRCRMHQHCTLADLRIEAEYWIQAAQAAMAREVEQEAIDEREREIDEITRELLPNVWEDTQDVLEAENLLSVY